MSFFESVYFQKLFEDPIEGFTLVLAIAAIIQFFFLIRADNTSRKAAEAAQVSAEAAKDAVALAVERPWLFIYGVKELISDYSDQICNEEIFVQYNVANYGKAPAIIKEVYVDYDINPLRPDEGHSLIVSPFLAPGEIRRDLKQDPPGGMRFFNPRPDIREEGFAVPVVEEGQTIIFRVMILYAGPSSDMHISSACWAYDFGVHHFVKYGHDDYNFTK